MNDIIFEAVKLLVMVAALVAARYVVPWLKIQTEAAKGSDVCEWVELAVLAAQQTLSARSGGERKAYVVDFVSKVMAANKIDLTPEQLDVLIEAAVKQMKQNGG